MILWPESLVREIAKERCVLFLGAGVSASAKTKDGNSPPRWSEFLMKASELVQNTDKKALILKLISENKLLIALQAISESCNVADYRRLLDQEFNNMAYQPSGLHKVIYDLNARLVITTNFDKIYERYCMGYAGSDNAFKVVDYKANDLADEIRSDTRLIVKAHGSIDKISDMIFTKLEYHNAKKDHPQFYEVLKAIFLTNTIVFIGCGLEDPDIMLLLEDVRIAGRQQKPHYALSLKGGNPFIISDWKQTYNIDVLEYEPDHTVLSDELTKLLEQVEAERAMLSGIVVHAQ